MSWHVFNWVAIRLAYGSAGFMLGGWWTARSMRKAHKYYEDAVERMAREYAERHGG